MTFDKYIQIFARRSRARGRNLRLGQIAYNLLPFDVASKLPKELDIFYMADNEYYGSTVVDDFFVWVKENWK